MSDYFEDLDVGETDSFGAYEVTRDGIVDFGQQFDPQPFHVDEEAASESMFGGLVASGWHTASMTMRLLVDNFLSESRALGAAGIDDLRFRTPVQPGDSLTVDTEIVDKEHWDDQRGLVHCYIETSNDEEVVMTMTGLVLWERE